MLLFKSGTADTRLEATIIHPSIFKTLCLVTGGTEAYSSTRGEWWSAAWTGSQSVSGHTCSQIHTEVSSSLHLHDCRLWEHLEETTEEEHAKPMQKSKKSTSLGGYDTN